MGEGEGEGVLMRDELAPKNLGQVGISPWDLSPGFINPILPGKIWKTMRPLFQLSLPQLRPSSLALPTPASDLIIPRKQKPNGSVRYSKIK